MRGGSRIPAKSAQRGGWRQLAERAIKFATHPGHTRPYDRDTDAQMERVAQRYGVPAASRASSDDSATTVAVLEHVVKEAAR